MSFVPFFFSFFCAAAAEAAQLYKGGLLQSGQCARPCVRESACGTGGAAAAHLVVVLSCLPLSNIQPLIALVKRLSV